MAAQPAKKSVTFLAVIASQALISGVFSLTAQAQQLDFFPKFLVMHTSRGERGQVYVPTTNWLLCFACLLLVLTFRKSESLAAAYGLAVVGTMVILQIFTNSRSSDLSRKRNRLSRSRRL